MSASFPPSIPPREMPAARLAEQSATYLSDTELLSLVLARNLSVPRSLETARSLLTKAGGIKRLARMSYAELVEIDGLGPASACTVRAALALASRLIFPDADCRPKLETPSSNPCTWACARTSRKASACWSSSNTRRRAGQFLSEGGGVIPPPPMRGRDSVEPGWLVPAPGFPPKSRGFPVHPTSAAIRQRLGSTESRPLQRAPREFYIPTQSIAEKYFTR